MSALLPNLQVAPQALPKSERGCHTQKYFQNPNTATSPRECDNLHVTGRILLPDSRHRACYGMLLGAHPAYHVVEHHARFHPVRMNE
jgi:hypothetical protein